MALRFTVPRDVYYGRGSLAELANLKGKKAFVVTGKEQMKKAGVTDKVEGFLKDAGFEVKIFSGVEPNPSRETARAGAAAMQEFQPDWIVAVGGGSAMDCAKCMWIKYEYNEESFQQMTVPFTLPTLRTKARFAAVCTTSGTGSEVTCMSIMSDYGDGVKYPIADFNITPDVAIVDPDLAELMPPRLTAFTGMDALTHALEAYVSTAATPITDAVALHAVRLIYENLVASYKGEPEARENMTIASTLAGMAFSNAILGIVHSMAHKTGIVYKGGQIIHGCANAMYLPKVIQFNAKDPKAAARYADLARYAGIREADTKTAVDKLAAHVRSLNDDMAIPQSIQNYGPGGERAEKGIIEENDFLEKLSAVAANALLDPCTGTNPRKPSQEEMEQLLKCCYYDKDVDF